MTHGLMRLFNIYESKLGRYFPKTRPPRMLELFGAGQKHPVCNKDVRALLGINRPSATKLLNKLCRLGMLQRAGWQSNEASYELSDKAVKLISELEEAVGGAPKAEPSRSRIPLDELEAGIGALAGKISELHAKAAGRPEASGFELLPKRRSVTAQEWTEKEKALLDRRDRINHPPATYHKKLPSW